MLTKIRETIRWPVAFAIVALSLTTLIIIGCTGGKTTSTTTTTTPPKVVVTPGTAQTAVPGATVTLKGTAKVNDASKITGYEWTQTAGIPLQISDKTAATTTVTLAQASAYKSELIKGLEDLDRVQVVSIIPHALVAADTATFKLTVTTSSGKYSANVNVVADLPFIFSTGIQAVPKNVAVMVQGKTQSTYDWAVTSAPAGSKASLSDSTSRYPYITPDIDGKYTLTEKASKATLDIYAGTWAGAITGIDAKGKPLSAGCTVCHDGKTASNNFTDWAKSGHAEIFTQNMENPAGHWTESCAECHVVGYDKAAVNNGWDEAMVKEKWVVPAHGEVGLWSKIVKDFPQTAKLSNIQCENCHGPNDGTGLHPNKVLDTARISLSSDVCGSCHGEPPRHGRFQQWENSGHGNFELAIDESGSANCARCHTAQGFMTWIKQGGGDLSKQIQGANGNATAAEMSAIVTKDTAQPQTCVVCHDPHDPGSVSKTATTVSNAKVRFSGDTSILPSGYQAKEVGKGAICITCHNTRNGAKDDSFPITAYQAPHAAAQGDVLMGQNSYFVADARSPHSYIEDTCVTCHLDETPPPKEYSSPGVGTNHGFKATLAICGECHSETLNGAALQSGVEDKLAQLSTRLGTNLFSKIGATVTIKDYTPHTLNNKNYDAKSDAAVINKDNIVSLVPTEPHGQQGYIVTFKTPVTFTYKTGTGFAAGEAPHTQTLKEAEVQLGDITTDGTKQLIPLTDPLVKAGWNYFLIHGDASDGIHNPAWTNDVLDASIAALK